MTETNIDFTDLDDLDSEDTSYVPTTVQQGLARDGLIGASHDFSEKTLKSTSAQRIEVKCPKCRGTGRFIGYTGRDFGECFACKGKGHQLRAANYHEMKAKREEAKKRKAAEKAGRLNDNISKFTEQHPRVYAAIKSYLIDKGNGRYSSEFMDSIVSKFFQYGELTENQIAAIERGIAKRDAARAAREQAPVAVFPRIERLVRVDNLKLNLGVAKVVVFQSGSVGVVGPQYGTGTFGIIEQGGELRRFRAMTDEVFATLQDVEARGIEALKSIGIATGRCCVCGRTLTDENSIAAGIGPVCAEKAAGL